MSLMVPDNKKEAYPLFYMLLVVFPSDVGIGGR